MKKDLKGRLFKKNQIIITTLALMIAIAGYLNFAGNDWNSESSNALSDAAMEDGQLMDLSQEDVEAQSLADSEDGLDILVANEEEGDELPVVDETENAATSAGEESQEGNSQEEKSQEEQLAEELEKSTETPGEAVMTNSAVGVIAQAKLNRDQVRAKNKESLQEMIDSSAITQGQKQEAVETMLTLTENGEKEVAAETLLHAKGFTDVIVSITENSVDVVVNQPELTDVELAQIEDIVKRKTGVDGSQIVIAPVTP